MPFHFHEFVLVSGNQEVEQTRYFVSLKYIETSRRTLEGLVVDMLANFPEMDVSFKIEEEDDGSAEGNFDITSDH